MQKGTAEEINWMKNFILAVGFMLFVKMSSYDEFQMGKCRNLITK